MKNAVRLRITEIERRERSVTLRLPFRFGVVTLRESLQANLRVRISLEGGRSGWGVAAESLLPKWFDKDAGLTNDDNVEQLRHSLRVAGDIYLAQGYDTAFGHFADAYVEQQARCRDADLNPLIASFGPALIDRAVIDALGHALDLPFSRLVSQNIVGIRSSDLTPDLAGADLDRFLARLQQADTIHVRHTVGLTDPITAADQPDGSRIGDGLPETLEEVQATYGGRYYKLKLGGDVEADLDRLSRIASVLDASTERYRSTLDGNEQYEDVDDVLRLWRRMAATPRLQRLVASVLLIEQPLNRHVALGKSVAHLSAERPVIIDESDAELSSFPRALDVGYRGVSSKSCKGLYKSILNAARIDRLGSDRYILSGEDLNTWAGVSVQQDLALVSLLGLTNVERNGHHYIDGMCFASAEEQEHYSHRHPDLYDRHAGGPLRLRIREGRLTIGSLQGAGLGVAAEAAESFWRGLS